MPVTGRAVAGSVLLVMGAVLALLAVLVHHEFMRIYGDVRGTAFEGFTWGLTAGPSGLGLSLVAVAAIIGFMMSTRRWMRLTAGAIPVLILVAMFAVTPAALAQKMEKQFVSAPQCMVEDDGQHLRAQRDGMAFEPMPCPGGVWFGPEEARKTAPSGRERSWGSDICAAHH